MNGAGWSNSEKHLESLFLREVSLWVGDVSRFFFKKTFKAIRMRPLTQVQHCLLQELNICKPEHKNNNFSLQIDLICTVSPQFPDTVPVVSGFIIQQNNCKEAETLNYDHVLWHSNILIYSKSVFTQKKWVSEMHVYFFPTRLTCHPVMCMSKFRYRTKYKSQCLSQLDSWHLGWVMTH